MKRAKFGVIFFGMGVSMTRGKHMNSAGDSESRRRDERVHEVRLHADARSRQRHRGRRRPAVDDRLSFRRQPEPRLSRDSIRESSRRWIYWSAATTTRHSSSAPIPGATMPQPGHRPSGANSDDRSGSQSHPHEPAGARAHHDGGDGRKRAPAPFTEWTRFRCRFGRPCTSPYPSDEEVIRRILPRGRGQARRGSLRRRARRPHSPEAAPMTTFQARLLRGRITPSRYTHDGEPLRDAPHNRRKSLRSGERDRRRRQGHLHRRWPHRAEKPNGGTTIDATGMMIFPGGVDVHTHVAGGALNFARGLVPENQRAASKFLRAHAGAACRHRRHDADDVRDRLSVRGHGMDDGQRGCGSGSVGEAHARRAARHSRSWTSPPRC